MNLLWPLPFAMLAALLVACGSGGATEGPLPSPTEPELTEETPLPESNRPPPALSVSTGAESIEAGLGTFCYDGLCADAIGPITPDEELVVPVERLTATLAAETMEEISVTASRAEGLESQPICTVVDGIEPNGPLCENGRILLAWAGGGEGATLPATATGASAEIDVSSLEPGAYLVAVFVRFASGGDASYGVVINLIDAPGARFGP